MFHLIAWSHVFDFIHYKIPKTLTQPTWMPGQNQEVYNRAA
jgi:hypothetical protein